MADIIKPKVRGFICITTHPEGCAAHVQEQIDYIKSKTPLKGGPKNVLVIGASTGYGLSSRIAAAFGSQAKTLGVFFERPSSNGRPASAGWYNSLAFEKAAQAQGLYARSINGDAFSHDVKKLAIKTIKEEMGPIDLIIYSLASPRRTDPDTGEVYKSCLKPVGETFHGITLDTDKKLVTEVSIEPAEGDDIAQTIKVMGGEDWELWIDALDRAGLIAPGATSLAYSYIGPVQTWAIYKDGTIGKAKEHLEASAQRINTKLKENGNGRAMISVNKAIVTQASSAIPVVPLYISILYKVMKEMNLHEGSIEQIHRLFAQRLYNNSDLQLDSNGRIRIDDWEMKPEVQEAIQQLWPQVSSENLDQLTDFKGYQQEFLKLFGFALPTIDYDKPTEVDLKFDNLIES